MEKRGRGDVLFRNLNRDDGLWQTAQLKTKSNTSQPKAVKGEEKPRSKQRSAEEILAGFRSGWTEKLQEEPVTSDAQADLGERTERSERAARATEAPSARSARSRSPKRESDGRSPSRSRWSRSSS
ncbi:unnamed protein product [Durusdinium trenchii]|uniref:Uncharacterized protein n=1 Tax=Durusdinium trenchii TaxID=1381693 RepID=A0ABP0MGD9_9DINO